MLRGVGNTNPRAALFLCFLFKRDAVLTHLNAPPAPAAPATGGARKHMLKQPFFTTGCGAEPRKKILP